MTTRARHTVVFAGQAPATLALLAFTLAACGSGGGGGGGGAPSSSLFGPAQLISVDAPGVGGLAAADVDGDGDGDVLAVSQSDGSVTWYENVDGDGHSWVEHTISATAAGANSVAAVDLDCDGDQDAVATSFAAGVRWYENRDGLGLDWSDHLISFAPSQPMGLFVGDFDGDGHQDVLCGSFAGGSVVCFINVDGAGGSWTPRTVASGESAPLAVAGASIDGGDCLDVLVATAYSSQVAWHDNTDCEATDWPKRPVASGLATPIALLGADADGDGDLDVVTASMSADRIDLHRNLDGLGTAWDKVAIATGVDGARAIWAGDLDCDGDVDVLSAAELSDAVAWHENLGPAGSAWHTESLNSLADGVTAVLGTDIDGDGLIDAVSASSGAGTIEWYHNQLPGEGFTLAPLADQSACAGDTLEILAEPIGPGPFSYEWSLACSGAVLSTGPTLTLSGIGPEDAGLYELSVTSGFRTLTRMVRVIVLEGVTATDPTDLSVCVGEPVTLSTTAGGSGPFTYSWTRDGSSSVLGSAASLPLGSVDVDDSGTYTVAVGGACGSTLQSVVLAVNAAATASDPADQSACPGGAVSFSTTPSGTGPFTFEWTKAGGGAVLGTSSSLQLSGLSVADAGTYQVTVSGACGAATQQAQLTVDENISTTAPGDVSACPGGTVILTTQPSGAGPFTYQWTKGVANSVLGTGSSLTLTGVGPGDVGLYTVTVTGSCGSASQSASVSLNAPLSITDPSDQQPCLGGSASFSTSASGTGPFSYAWTRSGSSQVLGTGSLLSLSNIGVADTGTYVVTVSGPCSTTSQQALLSLAQPTDATVLQNISVQPGAAAVTIGPTVPSGTGPFTYSWTKDGQAVPGASGPSLLVAPITDASAGQYTVTVTGNCGSVSRSASLAISAAVGGGRKGASVLVFPVNHSGPEVFTFLTVTNTNYQANGSTLAHYDYYNATPNPADPFHPLSCNSSDRVEFLTPADTLTVLTTCHNPAGPGREGYVVVAAQNPAKVKTPWSHNHLIGSELVIYASGTVYALNAIPLQALPAPGQPTDLDGDGRLDFDGVEYGGVANQLMMPSFIADSGAHLTLLNLTGGGNAVNRVQLSFWNDDEVPFSAQFEFSCWFDQPLSTLSDFATLVGLQSLPNDPLETDTDCNGVPDIETGWLSLDSYAVRLGGDIISFDGALLGAHTSGPTATIGQGELLWESAAIQLNGTAGTP